FLFALALLASTPLVLALFASLFFSSLSLFPPILPQAYFGLNVLEEEKRLCQQPFEQEIAELQRPFQTTKERKGKPLPGKVKRKAHDLRTQMKTVVQRLEADFQRRELRTLERDCFDQSMLQAESRVFGEE